MSALEPVLAEIRKATSRYATLPDKFLAIDTETTGVNLFHGDKPFAVSTCDQDGNTNFWRCAVDPATRNPLWKKSQLREMSAYLKQFDVRVFHNAKFDIRGLASIGCPVVTNWGHVRDTMIYSHVLDSQESHGLKPLAAKYLGIPDDDLTDLKKAVISARRQLTKENYPKGEEVEADYWLAGPELEEYAVNDARRTALLYAMYVNAIKQEGNKRAKENLFAKKGYLAELSPAWQVAREHALLSKVYAMESEGLRVNKSLIVSKRRAFAAKGDEHAKKSTAIAVRAGMPKDFNPGSSKQLQVLLFDKWKLQSVKATKSGAESTDAESLERLLDSCSRETTAGKFLQSLLDGRSYLKACSALDEYERLAICYEHVYKLHPSFNQTGTHTTRFSSSNPNAQNVSTDKEFSLREVFGPSPGTFWIDADYSNLEMRLFAYAANEKKLIAAFERGETAHLPIAEELYGPREKWKGLNRDDWTKSPEYKKTKNGNFSLIYGAGAPRADKTYGVPGAYNRIRTRFARLSEFMQETINKAKDQGYVETMFGYRLHVPPDRAYAAVNYLIQGTAGCAMKYAMLVFDSLTESGKMLATVHDELVTEWPKSVLPHMAANITKTAMEAPGKLIGIPLPVDPDLIEKCWTVKTTIK